MMKISVLFFAILLSGAQVYAMECPVKFGTDNYVGGVSSAIQATKSCEEGARVAEACALGSSADNGIAGAAQSKCEQDFLNGLPAGDRGSYYRLQLKCDAKYREMKGTMYVSFHSFCYLSIARLYSELFTKAE